MKLLGLLQPHHFTDNHHAEREAVATEYDRLRLGIAGWDDADADTFRAPPPQTGDVASAEAEPVFQDDGLQ